jgi:hypothetical protein
MKIQQSVFLFIFLLLASFRLFGQEKRAFKLLDKKEYEKLSELLHDVTVKDSISPGAYYIKSLSFSEKLNPAYNTDSAYGNIRVALDQYQLVSHKEQDKLLKAGIDTSRLLLQKKRVESLAFDEAKSGNSIESYNFFIGHFQGAPQTGEAIILRDKAAFEKASGINNYEAYLEFIKTYPEARQVPEARIRYDRLIYGEFTRDSTLQSYEQFARNFPASEHWEEAVKNIFKLSVAGNDPASYRNFMKNYPQSFMAPVAAGYLYYTSGDSLWFYKSHNEDFLFLDSLKKIFFLDTLTIFPVYENNHYGFMDGSGNEIIKPVYSKIDPGYLCGSVTDPYLVVWDDSSRKIVCRNGAVIYDQPFYSVENLNHGFIRLSRDAEYGILHQSGYLVLPFEFKDAGLVGNRLIKAKKDEGWALYTITGKKLTSEIFDDVEEDGNFLILERSGKLAVTTVNKVLDILNNAPFDPGFKYDDVVTVDSDHVLVISGNEEGIINDNLEFTIPLRIQHFYAYGNGWIVNRDSLSDIYDSKFLNISGPGLKNISFKGKWMTGNIRNKWILYYNYAPVPDEFLFDSVAIISENYVYIASGKKRSIIFRNYSKVNLDNYPVVNLVPRAQVAAGEDFPGYLMLTKKNHESYIINPDGKTCFSAKIDNIKSLGDLYILIGKNKKYGLLNLSGKEILKPAYEGIAGYHDGFVTLFSDRKFGLANPGKNILIKPEFTSAPEPLGGNYFMVRNEESIGVVDFEGNMILNTDGNQVKIWNDTSFLIHEGDKWTILGKSSGKFLYDGLTSIKEISASGNNKYYLVENDEGFGVIGNESGQLINLSFTDIVNIGSGRSPVYFAEKYIPEADLYVVIYYSSDGKLIRKQVFSSQEYSKIYCH